MTSGTKTKTIFLGQFCKNLLIYNFDHWLWRQCRYQWIIVSIIGVPCNLLSQYDYYRLASESNEQWNQLQLNRLTWLTLSMRLLHGFNTQNVFCLLKILTFSILFSHNLLNQYQACLYLFESIFHGDSKYSH